MIRIATIGTSAITRNLIDAIASTPGTVFAGALSRDAARAEAFTAEHGGTHPFTSLEELAGSDQVDAVYIGSPNALHHDQALACIAGNKHVLVEKPFCANAREAREVFSAAERAGVVALEAMRPLHDPAFHKVKGLLGELGPIRRATLRFGKYSSRYDEVLAGRATNIFDCAMATGSLMDIGVYSVEPLIELFGAPQEVHACTSLLDEGTRALTNGPIDGAGVILAGYPSMVASLHHSKTTNDCSPSQIEGELGTLVVEGILGAQLSPPRDARRGREDRCRGVLERPCLHARDRTPPGGEHDDIRARRLYRGHPHRWRRRARRPGARRPVRIDSALPPGDARQPRAHGRGPSPVRCGLPRGRLARAPHGDRVDVGNRTAETEESKGAPCRCSTR